MSTVYVPQQPARFDGAARLWVPTVNLDNAKQYGDVRIVLPPEASRIPIEQLKPTLQAALKDFTEDDYLIALGEPSIMVMAALIAAKRTDGFVRLLRWDRRLSDYIPLELSL